MLKIWGRPNSICTQRVLWACHEADVAYELELASGTMGATGHVSTGAEPFGHVNTAAYRKLNPNGTVPTMIDDDVVLWDSIAIVQYIASKFAADKMIGPATTLATALQWMCWTNERLESPLHILVMECVRLAPDKRDAQAAEAAMEDACRWLQVLDDELASRPYVAGDRFTIGDIPVGATVYRWSLFDLERPRFENVEAWQSRLADRPAFRKIVTPEAFHLS